MGKFYAAFTSLKDQPEGGWVERYECPSLCKRTDITEDEVEWWTGNPMGSAAGPPLRRKCPECGYSNIVAVKGDGPCPGTVLPDTELRARWVERTGVVLGGRPSITRAKSYGVWK